MKGILLVGKNLILFYIIKKIIYIYKKYYIKRDYLPVKDLEEILEN